MKREQVPVEKLEFGMYVAELDRPWTDTPFMYQGFQLRTAVQLAALKKFCKHVFVDPARTEPPEKVKLAAPAAFKVRGNTAYPEKARVEEEFKVAQPIFEQTAKRIDDLLQPMTKAGGAAGTVLDAKEVKESVTRLTDSVVRNPDAMLLVSRLREKSAEAHARALQVSLYMIVFARFLQLQREELEMLGLLGLLQDIGKTRLPPELLAKKGPLTAEESELAKQHVIYSAEILKTTPGIPPELLKLVLLHHERQDGTGYPNALRGDEIGLYGSMAAICDTFDALTAVRPYAEPLSPSSALSFLYKERGTGFHGELVEQFIQCVGAFPVGSVVELNSGEVGIVIAQNLLRRLKPRVMVVLDPKGAPVRPHKILDLDRDPKVTPDEPYKIRRTLEQSKVNLDPREFFI
ncbi:MAG TPA: HD domain-containing phosphohydrolase [Burkholderiales bacterium]|nr:HD domain-containing phosphohydrolase [Burkholderiales bacterium]